MPMDMDNWVKYTQHFDNQWRELQSIKSSIPTATTQWNNPFHYNSSNTPSSMNNSVIPMAVDAIRTPLTDDKRSRLRAEGRCFYCRQKGHMTNQCLVRALSRVPEESIGHVQLSNGKMGNRPAQASGLLASREGSNGRAFSA